MVNRTLDKVNHLSFKQKRNNITISLFSSQLFNALLKYLNSQQITKRRCDMSHLNSQA